MPKNKLQNRSNHNPEVKTLEGTNMSSNQTTPATIDAMAALSATSVEQASSDAGDDTSSSAVASKSESIELNMAESAAVEKPTTPSVPNPVIMPEVQVAQMATVIPDDLSPQSRILLATLVKYTEDMAPRKRIDSTVGVQHQMTLYRTIRGIINDTADEFQVVFGTMLKLFDEKQDGVFHETYVFRFFDRLTLDETNRKAFTALLNFIKVMAPPKGRTISSRQVNFDSSLQSGVTEQGRQRVLSFFNRA